MSKYIVKKNGKLIDKITGEEFKGKVSKDLLAGDKFEDNNFSNRKKYLMTVEEVKKQDDGALIVVSVGSEFVNA